jgi:hypothetical protein
METPNYRRTWFGLNGKRRSGKDTVVQIMTNYFNKVTPEIPVFHISFGEMIREEYCANSQLSKAEYEANKEHHRKELIKIGERPEYWMQRAFAKINELPKVNSYLIISGVRYIVQANTLLSLGSFMFRINRPMMRNLDIDSHRSECELDTWTGWSAVINNTGCMRTLENRTIRFLDAWLEGRMYTKEVAA